MTNPNEPIAPFCKDNGLTKLEWFTGMALCGLCGAWRVGEKNSPKEHAVTALKMAKETINQLNQPKNEQS